MPADVGATLRRARKDRGLTLVQLAERSGVSQPFLSRVENGSATPSVARLYSIAEALGVSVGSLLGDLPPTGEPSVTRSDAARTLAHSDNTSVGDSLVLTDPTSGTLLTGLLHTMRPGHLSGDTFTHAGEDLLHVISGHVGVRIGEQTYYLGPGDSIHHSGELPHTFVDSPDTADDETIRVLIVTASGHSTTQPH